MSARTRQGLSLGIAMALLAPLTGCQGLSDRLTAKHQPAPGVIDVEQPHELQMVSMPRYVLEPPDELEIVVRPTALDFPMTTVTVQSDGMIDLGFFGDVYISGLTLDEVEVTLAEYLQTFANQKKVKEAVDVSIRLVNGSQSKSFYVLGTVTTQGKFPITGNDTVLDGILSAGLRANSMPDKAYLVRPQPTGHPDLILKIDWKGIKERGETMTNYQLFPGDRIIVPGGKEPGLLGTLLGGN